MPGTAVHQLPFAHGGQEFLFEGDRSLRGEHQADNQFQEHWLPAAALADDHYTLSAFNLQIDLAEHVLTIEPHGQFVDGNDRFGHDNLKGSWQNYR